MPSKMSVAILAIALAACGQEQHSEQKFRAGQWQVKAELISVEQPGNPGPQPSEPEPQTIDFCMTTAQAREPGLDILVGSPPPSVRCQGNLSLTKGKIRGDNRCTISGVPATLEGRFEGEFGPDSYVLRGRTEQSESGRIVTIIRQQWTGRRTGECRG